MSTFPLYDRLAKLTLPKMEAAERVSELRKLSSLEKPSADAALAMVIKHLDQIPKMTKTQKKKLYKKKGRGKNFQMTELAIVSLPEDLQMILIAFLRELEGSLP